MKSIILLLLFPYSFLHSIRDPDITVTREISLSRKGHYYNDGRENLYRNLKKCREQSKGRVVEILRMHDSRSRDRRLCCRGTPPRGCGILRSNLQRDTRRGCDKDTHGRAEAYNCRGTELDSKAAATHKDTAGCYYNNVQVSCRHLKGPRCFSRGTAIFGRSVRGKRYIHPYRERKMTFSSASASFPRVVFDLRKREKERNQMNWYEGGILQKMPSKVFYIRKRFGCIYSS